MSEFAHDHPKENALPLVRKLDAVGWGLFFIWIGIAFLADVGWGVGLLGVGVIALGTQVARKYLGLPVHSFWLLIGIAFVLCGLWQLLNIQLAEGLILGGLLPMLLVALGIVLIFSGLLRRPRH